MSLSAEINSPFADGCLQRGILMLRNDFTQGTIDQLNLAEGATPTSHQLQTSTFAKAVATLCEGDTELARELFEEYITEYPTSATTLKARVYLADCDFYEGKYREALAAYDKINANAPDLATADDITYRKAYCRMMLGEYSEALSGFQSLSTSPTYANAARFYRGYIKYTQGEYSEAKQLFESVNQTTAPGNQASYYLTQIAFREEDYNKALSMARRAIADDTSSPYYPEMLRIAGESLYHTGENIEAIDYLNRYIAAASIDNAEPSALYILGINEYQQGNLDDAIKLLTPVTECDDALGQSAYLYIGQAYLQKGNKDTALMALEKAYKLDYDRSVKETAFYNYAVTRSEGGRTPFGSSVAIMENFLSEFPNSRFAPQVLEYLVTGYMTDNNYNKALTSINSIKNPSAAILAAKQRVLYILGSRDLANNRTSSALERFTESKSLAANADKNMGAETDLWIGDCQYRLGNYSAAASSFNSYLRSASKTSPNRSIATYNLGYTRFAQRDYSSALTNFKSVVSSAATDNAIDERMLADTYSRIGDCYYYTSDFNAAATNYDKALSANPTTGDYPLFQKAVMRGLAGNNTAKIEMLDQMMTSYPSSGLMPSALLEKAESYLALNQSDKAIQVYSTLIKKYPATSQGRNGYLQMAITQMSLGQTSKAIETYKKVISNYPTSDEARIASDDLKRILADEGQLDQYTAFIASVPNAPSLDASEIDQLTFQSAEKAYLASGATQRLKSYVDQFPSGQNAAQALSYLANSAYEAGNTADALTYATTLVNRFPHSESAEEGLAIKGDIELEKGETKKALATFRSLESSASGDRNLLTARLGILRASRDLGNHADVITQADALLASSNLSAERRSEVLYARAYAYSQTGKTSQAATEWEKLAKNPNELYGAMAAYQLAQQQFDAGKTKQARTTVNALIDSNTPHQYWLARGYILLSDICRRQGNTFEADEYLKSLKENYPGSEADIFQLINTRLKK
jgi:TolA-binding protein